MALLPPRAANFYEYASSPFIKPPHEKNIPDHEFHSLWSANRFLEIMIHEIAEKYKLVAQFTSNNWQARIIGEKKTTHIIGFDMGLNGSSSARICDDKAGTSAVLGKEVPHIPHRFFARTTVPEDSSSTITPSLLRKICNLFLNFFLAIGHFFLSVLGMSTKDPEITVSKEWERIDAFAKEHNYQIVCKPKSESGGTGVERIENPQELKEKLRNHFKTYSDVCLSPYEKLQSEYRIVMLNGTPELVFKKIPPHIIGDGKSTISALYKKYHEKNIRPKQPEAVVNEKQTLRENYTTKVMNIREKASIKALQSPLPSHLDPDKIPAANEIVELNWRHNLGLGATSEFLDHTVSLEESKSSEAKITPIQPVAAQSELELTRNLINLAKKAAAAVGIVFASVDIARLADGSLKVMEINSGVMMENLTQEHCENGKFFEGEGYRKAKAINEKAFCLHQEIPLKDDGEKDDGEKDDGEKDAANPAKIGA